MAQRGGQAWLKGVRGSLGSISSRSEPECGIPGIPDWKDPEDWNVCGEFPPYECGRVNMSGGDRQWKGEILHRGRIDKGFATGEDCKGGGGWRKGV